MQLLREINKTKNRLFGLADRQTDRNVHLDSYTINSISTTVSKELKITKKKYTWLKSY